MTFQALLFCPDEKTTRVATQVLNELEFGVETCSEPFVAVKKLMGQHFDAIVVDCDNEQNASLLFKSARNSGANQGSLAVAVVEGQAGVANAFRVGANLVLTKPINVEQAKSTLRVARGLLRKGSEAAKAGAPASAPSVPAAIVPASPRPKPETVRPAAPAPAPKPVLPVPQKPVAQPAVAAAKATTEAAGLFQDQASAAHQSMEDFLFEKPKETAASVHPSATETSRDFPRQPAARSAGAKASPGPRAAEAVEPPAFASAPGGAASAPAPARESFKKASVVRTPSVPLAPAQQPAQHGPSASAPTFASLDGQTNDGESSESGRRTGLIVVLVLALLAAVAYFGYTKFFAARPSSTPPAQVPPMTSVPPQPSVPSQTQTVDSTTAADNSAPTSSQPDQDTAAQVSRPARPDISIASSDAPEVVIERQPVAPKLVVKSGLGGSHPTRAQPAANAEVVDAPEIANVANSDPNAISTMVKSSAPIPTTAPPKEAIRVSQGVTQGLLLRRVQPLYPQQAMQMRVQGAVQLQAVISKTGNVSNIKLISGDPVLGRAAIQAVNQWKYKPYYLGSEPVEIQTQITVNFNLP